MFSKADFEGMLFAVVRKLRNLAANDKYNLTFLSRHVTDETWGLNKLGGLATADLY